MTIRLIIAQIVFCIASTSAIAQNQNIEILLENGDFVISEHAVAYEMAYDNGMCLAEVNNSRSQSLGIEGYQSDKLFITLRDDRWKLTGDTVNVMVEIGDSSWKVDAWADESDGNVTLLFQDDPADAQRIMDNLAGAAKITFLTENGNSLAEFSLFGSLPATNSFFDCWARRQSASALSADPFAAESNSDPFGYTLTDSGGIEYSVNEAIEGTTPDNATGAVLLSINTLPGPDHHVSFGMYSDCSAYSLRYGWGSWSWANGGFEVIFETNYFSFPRGESPSNLGTGCRM